MGWKLRKDKLRAETADAPQPSDDETPETETSGPAAAELTPPEAVGLKPLPHDAPDAPAFDAPLDLNEPKPSPNADTLSLDRPEEPPVSHGAQGDLDNSAVFDPLPFDPELAANDLDAAAVGTDHGSVEAPVFGVESVFAPEDDEETSFFAPMSSAFDPLPDDTADAIAMPPPAPEPVVLGGDTGGTFGAFAPYQPANEEPEGEAAAAAPDDDAAYSDPELEVGASAFDPQSPSFGAFDPQAPTAGEETAQETTGSAFADASDTSPLAFEPSFEAPNALAGGALPAEGDDGDEPFMDREALAAGLVTMEPSSGLPRVAPYVPAGAENPAFADDGSGPHSLVLRLGNLSATYPLTKPVTTIGRPDGETGTYPDVEVELDDGVSRRHAEVHQEGENLYVVDLGSTNGTILNGEMLTPNQPVRLMRGDRIRIGERVEIVLE